MSVPAEEKPLDRAVVDFVGGSCDLEQRLLDAPPSARLRGVWISLLEGHLRRRGLEDEYSQFFEPERWSSMRYYWVGEYLKRVAVIGALIAGRENIHTGMYEAVQGNAKGFAGTLLGRTLFRLLSRNPAKLLQQGVASRRQTMTYGRWRITSADEGRLEFSLEEEYIWIESCIAGASREAAEAVGMRDVRVETTLDGPYRGSICIEWNGVA